MNGDSDSPCLVRDCPGNRLAYPPCCVSGELVSLCVVELLNSLDESDVALLDKVQERHSSADKVLCNADDKTQVRFNKPVPRVLIAGADLFRKLYLLLGGEQGNAPYLLEVYLYGVVNCNAVGGIVAVIVVGEIQGVVQVAGHDVVNYLDVVAFKVIIQLVYLFSVNIHLLDGVGYLLGGELSVLLSALEKLADNFRVAHYLSFPVLLCTSNDDIIPGSPSVSCCGWGGGAFAAPLFRSGGFSHG